MNFSIPKEVQKRLLFIARKTIEDRINGKESVFENDMPELKQQAAVFVTLTQHGMLRGCIGNITPQSDLLDAVVTMARQAAFSDPRFPPLTEKDLPEVRIEISVLSPMQKVRSHNDIEKDVHGVMIKKDFRSGLFLPQVWEHFSSKEDFMNELCTQKASLPRDAWKQDNIDIFVFTVFKFEE
ncbi:MAG: AmmeMemoRadiSam system protein A [Candidatus Muiribacteriaceae bacterium]